MVKFTVGKSAADVTISKSLASVTERLEAAGTDTLLMPHLEVCAHSYVKGLITWEEYYYFSGVVVSSRLSLHHL